MYDKHLISLETDMIKNRIRPDSKILDAGCGEAEGTKNYAKIKGVKIHAADFSKTRLELAKKNLRGANNVILKQVDFLGNYDLDSDYDYVISQRFLINLMELKLQKKVILDLMKRLKKGGRFLMFEGSVDGVKELNDFRALFKLDPIPVKWHNKFFDDKRLVGFMEKNKFKLIETGGLGEYFLLTRGLRPIFDNKLNWDSPFNKIASGSNIKKLLNFNDRFSRIKLWVFEK
jgi:ubiquinone/menaquinone biosynthesis C-methylase UbiE